MQPTYHGAKDEDTYLIHTEYRARFSTEAVRAGLGKVSTYPFEFPTAVADRDAQGIAALWGCPGGVPSSAMADETDRAIAERLDRNAAERRAHREADLQREQAVDQLIAEALEQANMQ
jgi:hypothetical protein